MTVMRIRNTLFFNTFFFVDSRRNLAAYFSCINTTAGSPRNDMTSDGEAGSIEKS